MSINMNIPIEKLQKKSLFVAVPMFGGQCFGTFARSIADLSAICTNYGIQIKFYFIFNESLIPRARNYCADEFLRSGDTHMLFIDADIGFDARDVIAMLAMQDEEDVDNPYDVICAPYAKKAISWEKIKLAVDKGIADEDPGILERFVGDYVFNPASGATQIPINEPVEVLESGTGFMMIRRNTFLKFADAYPGQKYTPDHIRTEHFDGSRQIVAFFDTPIDPDSNRYLSEDYYFCQASRKIGLKVWLCPWMKLSHTGSMVFGGSLADLSMIGANATADPNQLNKPHLNKGGQSKNKSQLNKFKKKR